MGVIKSTLGYLGFGTVVAATTYEITKNKYMRRRITLGVAGGATLLYLSMSVLPRYMVDSQEIKKIELEMQRERERRAAVTDSIDRAYKHEELMNGKSAINPKAIKDEVSKEISADMKQYIGSEVKNVVGSVVGSEMKQVYDQNRKFSSEISQKVDQTTNLVKQSSTNLENVVKQSVDGVKTAVKEGIIASKPNEQYARPQEYTQPNTRIVKTIESYVLDIDKSDNRLKVLNNEEQEVYSCSISLARNGGPPAGTYSVVSIISQDGDLYPGFIKLNVSPLGIAGPGESGEYNNAIQQHKNIARTGGRVTVNDYRAIVSLISGKRAIARVTE